MAPHTLLTTSLLSLLLLPPVSLSQTTSPKRGLCHIPNNPHPQDDQIWLSGPSPPTWYYNYGATPSPAYTSSPQLHFIPMLWGASPSDTGTPFQDTIKAQLRAGKNITHVLSFNEPDAPHSVGGSQLLASLAATRWKAELEPLRAMGVKVGAPAVTGAQSGWNWLENWYAECGGGCEPDFVVVHWYGDFQGLMSHVGRVAARWPALPIWITEFGVADRGIEDTQEFFNQSLKSFDSWRNISRYSYFGAFRSDTSNVGPNAAMLTEQGKLTDIGSWYLGGGATGNVPMRGGGASSGATGAAATMRWSGGSMAMGMGIGTLWVVVMIMDDLISI